MSGGLVLIFYGSFEETTMQVLVAAWLWAGVGYDVGVRPGCSGVRVVDSPGIVVRNLTTTT